MTKAAVVVLAGNEGHADLGRVVNALTTANDFKEAGEDSTIVFDGAGTVWIPELAKEDHKAHPLYLAVQDRIAGACAFCAKAFGVKEQVEELDIPLLDEYRDHPSLRKLVSDGYQVITF